MEVRLDVFVRNMRSEWEVLLSHEINCTNWLMFKRAWIIIKSCFIQRSLSAETLCTRHIDYQRHIPKRWFHHWVEPFVSYQLKLGDLRAKVLLRWLNAKTTSRNRALWKSGDLCFPWDEANFYINSSRKMRSCINWKTFGYLAKKKFQSCMLKLCSLLMLKPFEVGEDLKSCIQLPRTKANSYWLIIAHPKLWALCLLLMNLSHV